jgi:hypothetical protein
MPLTQIQAGMMDSVAQYYGFKNRIINPGMVIDQRNAGASVTPTNGQYTVDRWSAVLTQASKFTVQQNAASVTPPVGFTNYLGITSSSAYSVLTSDAFGITQPIEGLNTADLAWGTADAATVTLSFWVRSSLTGTFGGVIKNNVGSRSYPFTYTINSANTWEKETITIAGDTSGTWLTTNGIGIYVLLGIGCGASVSGTAGAWAGSNFFSATGAVSVVGTNGATFYITGVQLEKGSTATSFDYRPYTTELQLCQRYYYQYASANTDFQEIVTRYALTLGSINVQVPVSMRSAPTAVLGSSPFGRVVGYDSAFNATIANVTGFNVGTPSSLNTIFVGLTHASVSAANGLYGFSFDTNANPAIGLSSEL